MTGAVSTNNPLPFQIVGRSEIADPQTMIDAITRIHQKIDQQKDPNVIDWQCNTSLAITRLRQKTVAYFVRLNEELVGYAIMRDAYPYELPSDHHPEEKGHYLSFIALDPSYNRNGMGKALMKTMRHEAKILQSDFLVLDHRGYEKLNNFYMTFKRGVHTPCALECRMNPETAQMEEHRKVKVVYQLKKPAV